MSRWLQDSKYTARDKRISQLYIADKSLKLMLSAKGATGVNSVFFRLLQQALKNYNFQLSVIQKFMEKTDNSAEKIKDFLKDKTARLSASNISKV